MIGWRCDELLSRVGVGRMRVPLKSRTNAKWETESQDSIREAWRLMRLGRSQEAGERYRACVKGNDIMARVVEAEVEKR